MLTIADSVIGGFGRLGTWLGVERFGLEPDLIVFAKGVTSGYLPLGGVIASPRVAEPFWEEPGLVRARLDLRGAPGVLRRGAREPRPARRGRPRLPRTRARVGLPSRLSELGSHELVGEVRGGVGLMAAVALEPDVAREPAATRRLWLGAREAAS